MSDNKKTNKSADPFSEYIRKRLKTHSIPPDENCWNEIEARLQIKRKRFPVRAAIAIAASVLSAVLLLYHIIINNEQETQYAFVESNDISIQNPIPEDTHTIIANRAGEKTDKIDKRTEHKANIGFPQNRIDNSNASVVTDEHKEDAVEQEEPTICTTEEKSTENSEGDKTKSADFYENKKQDECQMSENQYAYNLPSDKLKRRKSWQINAGFGTGAGATNSLLNSPGRQPPGNDFASGNNGLQFGNSDNSLSNGTSSSCITNIDYAIPISVGLTVRKKLNKTIGIETGLIYTYLSTDYDVTDNQSHKATLNLHYLGIPANLIVNLWDKRQWNLYLSGGGMVEKGLQAVYKQKSKVNYHFLQDKNKSNISGLQWALNGGLGISYNLYKDMNLYVEPTISYYFDCNQPLSKRTEDPLNFSIRAGIRYDF
ncbi:MAG: PorT family protein [Tannerella sp.]|nr:PorT family protein [Tannerella sp.]